MRGHSFFVESTNFIYIIVARMLTDSYGGRRRLREAGLYRRGQR